MREIKFSFNRGEYEEKDGDDDIVYAFKKNGLSKRLEDIDIIVAEVCGANDEFYWYWILKMKDKTFSWAKGQCDYTGWSCQSEAEIHDCFKTIQEAVEDLKTEEDETRKNIKQCLLGQIKGDIPFALYQEV